MNGLIKIGSKYKEWIQCSQSKFVENTAWEILSI